MTLPDILAVGTGEPAGIQALAAAIQSRLTSDERRQFLDDLARWNARYSAVMEELARSPEWREIEQWRTYIIAGDTSGIPGSA